MSAKRRGCVKTSARFHTSLFRSLLRGLRAFRVEKIAKNLALLDRLQNVAEFLHGLRRQRTLPSIWTRSALRPTAAFAIAAREVRFTSRGAGCLGEENFRFGSETGPTDWVLTLARGRVSAKAAFGTPSQTN
jgi:hypothetical protein